MTQTIRLTEYSHGAGCGCKIAPRVLDEMLSVGQPGPAFEQLWVGNASRDDAAVFGLDDEQGIVSTTDFFMVHHGLPGKSFLIFMKKNSLSR